MIIKTDYGTRKEMGQLLRDAIVEYINEGAITWLRKRQDLKMWDVTIKDSEDLIAIAGMIDTRSDDSYSESNKESARRPVNTKGWSASAGLDIQQAFMAACDLDTAVRDVFPREVWNWMAFVAQEQKKQLA